MKADCFIGGDFSNEVGPFIGGNFYARGIFYKGEPEGRGGLLREGEGGIFL